MRQIGDNMREMKENSKKISHTLDWIENKLKTVLCKIITCGIVIVTVIYGLKNNTKPPLILVLSSGFFVFIVRYLEKHKIIKHPSIVAHIFIIGIFLYLVLNSV